MRYANNNDNVFFLIEIINKCTAVSIRLFVDFLQRTNKIIAEKVVRYFEDKIRARVMSVNYL